MTFHQAGGAGRPVDLSPVRHRGRSHAAGGSGASRCLDGRPRDGTIDGQRYCSAPTVIRRLRATPGGYKWLQRVVSIDKAVIDTRSTR
jgi:hypothetical protein